MDCYGGYEMIQSPRVTESERPIPWHGLGTPDDARLSCKLRPGSHISHNGSFSSFETSETPSTRQPLVQQLCRSELRRSSEDFSPAPFFPTVNTCREPDALSSSAPCHSLRCKNEALWLDDESEEMQSWELGSEDVPHAGYGGSSDEERGEEDECRGHTVMYSEEMQKYDQGQNGGQNIGEDLNTENFRPQKNQMPQNGRWSLHHSYFANTANSVSISFVPPSSLSQPLVSTPGDATYTRRILSAFHQWKYDVGSTICAYVHNMKNWTGLGGDEFVIRDFILSESAVFLLGRRFSLDESSFIQRMSNPSCSSSFTSSPISQAVSSNSSSPIEAPINPLGSEGSKTEAAHRQLEKFINSLIFMSYRRDFPPMYRFENDSPSVPTCSVPAPSVQTPAVPNVIKVTSDAGWGCTIRCAQMLLFEVLRRHFSTLENSLWPPFRHQNKDDGRATEKWHNPSHYLSPLIHPRPQMFQFSCSRESLSDSTSPPEINEEVLLRWFLDVPSPPESHPFSVYAFVRSAGGGLGWAHPLYGQMALESKLLLSLQQTENPESPHNNSSLAPLYRPPLREPNYNMSSKSPLSDDVETISSSTYCDNRSSSYLTSPPSPVWIPNDDMRSDALLQDKSISPIIIPDSSKIDPNWFPFCPVDSPSNPIFFGKRPGDWFGPATASYSMKYIVETAQVTRDSLSVYVNADGVLGIEALSTLIEDNNSVGRELFPTGDTSYFKSRDSTPTIGESEDWQLISHNNSKSGPIFYRPESQDDQTTTTRCCVRPFFKPFQSLSVENRIRGLPSSSSTKKGVLLCFPLTLGGGRSLNSIYHSSICQYFELPWFVGAIGAKAGKKQAFYFLGKHEQNTSPPRCSENQSAAEGHRRSSSCDTLRCKLNKRALSKRRNNRVSRSRPPDMNSTVSSHSLKSTASEIAESLDVELLYLDPHIVQNCAVDVSLDWDSFHRPKLFRVSPRYLDPGLLISFYCEDIHAVRELAGCIREVALHDRHAPLTVSSSTDRSLVTCRPENENRFFRRSTGQCRDALSGFNLPRERDKPPIQSSKELHSTAIDPKLPKGAWDSSRHRRCRRAQHYRSGSSGSVITPVSSLGSPPYASPCPDESDISGSPVQRISKDGPRIRERHNSDGFVELSAGESPRPQQFLFPGRCSSDNPKNIKLIEWSESRQLSEQSDMSFGALSCEDCASPSLSFMVIEQNPKPMNSGFKTGSRVNSEKRSPLKRSSPMRRPVSPPASPRLQRNRSWFGFRPSRRGKSKKTRRLLPSPLPFSPSTPDVNS